MELTFHREPSCRFRAEAHGRTTPLPLTLAAGLRVVRLLEHLRPGDALTLTVQVEGNALKVEPVLLPPYLEERDVYRSVQDTIQSDYDHYQ